MTPRPVRSLPGIGPRIAQWLAEIGITQRVHLNDIGSVQAYVRLQQRFGPLSCRYLWALESAVTGLPAPLVARRYGVQLRARAEMQFNDSEAVLNWRALKGSIAAHRTAHGATVSGTG